MVFICPRCGYKTNQKGDMRKHFKRKNLCSATSADVDLRVCYKTVLGEDFPKTLKMTPIDSQVTPKLLKIDSQVTPIDSQEEKSDSQVTPIDSQTLNKNFLNFLKDSTNKSENKYICVHCGNGFSKNSNLHRHMRVCKEKERFSKEELDFYLQEKDSILKEKEDVISELKKQIELLLTKVGNVTNIQQNIYINPFGKENTEYIKSDYVKNLLDGVDAHNYIPNILKQIHFNPEHQENWNICIPNKKQPLAKVYDGAKWVYQNKKNTIENMTFKAYKTLIDNYDENNDKTWKKIVDNNMYHDDQPTKERIDKDTEIMILNSQNVLSKQDKII